MSPKRAALHPRATKRRGIVAQACRAAPPGDGKCGFRCRRVPFILTSFCLAPFGNENGLKCRLKVSCRTLGRRKVWVSLPKSPLHPYVILSCTFRQQKWAEVSPESVVPHSRATKSMGFVAEESPSSLRHSVLHLWASIMDRSVTQACRAAPSSDKKARNCCSSVPCCTPRRRKVWVSLPKSPIHPYVILPCTFRQRKWAEVSPESVVLHPRVTKMRDSVAQACRAALSGDEEALKCRSSVPCCTLGRRYWVKMLPEVGCGITS